MLRTDALALLLLQRLHALGRCSEQEAIDVLDMRAPGRGADVVAYAIRVGLVRRVAGEDGEPHKLKALGAPRSLAA